MSSQPGGLQFVVTARTELEVSLSEYLIAIKQTGYSQATLTRYEWHLKRLLGWLSERGVISPRQVTRVLLREWGAGLYEQWEPATVKQAVGSAKSFFRWCHEERLAEDNPAEALRWPKAKKRIQRTLTDEEVQSMIALCDIESVKGLRDRALISLLYDSGLRAFEVCSLRLDDLDLAGRIVQGIVKGGDEELAWFGDTTADYLAAWLRVRMAPAGIRTVFVSIGGTRPGYPLTVSGLYRDLRNIGDRAGLPKVSTHSFRRGFAVNLTRKGVPNSVLQDLGRWKDPAMIKHYTRGLQAGEVYKKFSPMDGLGNEEK